MSVLWLIEDSPNQLKKLQTFLTKLGNTVHAFRDADELLEHIADLPLPDAVVVDLALKVTSNGFQAAEEIRRQRPEIGAERFCFISGWKKSFLPLIPNQFRDNEIIDKGNWNLQQMQAALDHAMHSRAA
jgi:CheY-like chemotaxis protein